MVSENPVTGDSYITILVEDDHLSDYFNQNSKKDNRVRWLESQYSDTRGDKQGWRMRQYHDFIGVVNTHFMMTDYQKDRVWFLVQRVGDLQFFHRTASYEEIILALCFWVMRKDGRRVEFKDRRPRRAFNDFVDKVGLCEEVYLKVAEKVGFLKEIGG